MRVHELTITAFGPFADTEHLDFDALNDAGIFLLTGQTGAGKTSVLDAICFALYGAVPGARNRARTFKSQHVADDAVPRVRLELTVRDRRFRIFRSPAWRRPSRRARSGYVDEQPRVTLEEHVGGEWVTRATRIDEAGLLVRRVLGMTHEQFCQVVMLPQGQFETFLRADAKDRHHLLESLFETGRFRRIESWLADHRREREAAWAHAQHEIDQLLARASEVAQGQPPDGELAEVSEQSEQQEGRVATLRATHARLEEQSAAATAEAADGLAVAKAARHALDEATRRAERQERYRDARRRREVLETVQPEVDARADRLRRGQAAIALAPLLSMLTELEETGRWARELRDQRVAQVVAGSAVELASDAADDDGVGRLREALARAREQRGRLAELMSVEDDVVAMTAEAEQLGAAVVDAAHELGALDERARALPEELAQVGRELDAATAASAQVEAASDLVARARRHLHAAQQVEVLRPEVAAVEARELTRREARVAAAEHVQQLRQRRLDGYAAELAAQLRPDAPCPVCGSPDHPAPARPGSGQVSEPDERRAAERLQATERALEDATKQRGDLQARVARAEEAAAGMSVPAASEAVTVAERTQSAAVAARESLCALRAHRDALVHESDATAQELERLRTSAVTRSEQQAALLTRLDEARGRLDRELDGHASVRSRLTSLEDAITRLERALDADRQLHDATRQEHAQLARFEAALAESDFAHRDEVSEALLDRASLANLDALNRAHADELAAVSRVLAEPALVAAAAADEPDLGLLAQAAERADLDHARAHAAAVALGVRAERLQALLERIDADLGAAEPLRAARDVAERLASMTAGTSRDNEHKTKLSHYVVAARLEQVVAAANERLRSIGDGRYQLEHSLTRGAGSARGGLSLVVLDTYTDLRRDPVTLSGGETFYVSLALALGLADVVRAEAGGAELSTLFVDEGFGGLDTETLEEVMDTVDGLRAGGRSVGIVSHLGELRLRIPAQVQISRGRGGSHIRSGGRTAADLISKRGPDNRLSEVIRMSDLFH